MRSFLSITLLLILINPAIAGGRRRTAAASPASADELTIVFVGMDGGATDALFDAGVASRPRGVIVRTFGIRLDTATRTAGTAVLRARHDLRPDHVARAGRDGARWSAPA